MPIHGDDLGRPTYEILQTIGEGSAGVCRLARHEVFERDVVQKTVSMLGLPDGVAREPHLLKEARHDHLIEAWEAQWEKDDSFKGLEAVTFVCPYYPDGSVHDSLISDHHFGLGNTLRICGQILDALAYLHDDRGYIHRDIKPANILLTDERAGALLADLGSAGRINDSGWAANFGGTRLYLDPRARPDNQVTVQSDLYSLGVVVVEMLGGRFHYETINQNEVDERLDRGQRALPDRAYRLPPYVPANVARLVRSLVNPNPMKRTTTAREAWTRLSRLKFVDWQRDDLDDGSQSWVGTWPPHKARELRRQFRVSSELVSRGSHAGEFRLSARWRSPNGRGRNLGSLTRHTRAGDLVGLTQLFRAVEDVAQNSPA